MSTTTDDMSEAQLPSSDEAEIQVLVDQVEQHEHNLRRRALLATLVPLIVGAVILALTAWQIQQKGRELAGVTHELNTATANLATTNDRLTQTQTDAKRAAQELAATKKQLDQVTQELTTTRTQFDQATFNLTTATRQLEETKKELDAAQSRADDLQKQLDQLHQELQDAVDQLKLATDFNKYRFAGDWMLTLKSEASLAPRQFELLLTIAQLDSSAWHLGGLSPEEGFDSPSFAAYVLEQNGLLPIPAAEARSRLRDLLKPRSGAPQVGDVIFYPYGYTMFYFQDERKQPFVIGMTPLGVVALRPDFAKIIAVGAAF